MRSVLLAATGSLCRDGTLRKRGSLVPFGYSLRHRLAHSPRYSLQLRLARSSLGTLYIDGSLNAYGTLALSRSLIISVLLSFRLALVQLAFSAFAKLRIKSGVHRSRSQ